MGQVGLSTALMRTLEFSRMRRATLKTDYGPTAFLLERLVALAVSGTVLWGLIESNADFPAVWKVWKQVWNDGQITANDGSITPGTAFGFKGRDGRRTVRRFCAELLLDLFAFLRAGIGVQSTAADHSQTSWGNVLEPAGQK